MRIAVGFLALAGCGVTALDVREPVAPATAATTFTLGAFDLQSALATGDVVLVFYRGHW